MVLEEVEVSQITKTFLFSNSFIPVFSSTCCEVKFDHCKMILFTFNFPVQIP